MVREPLTIFILHIQSPITHKASEIFFKAQTVTQMSEMYCAFVCVRMHSLNRTKVLFLYASKEMIRL